MKHSITLLTLYFLLTMTTVSSQTVKDPLVHLIGAWLVTKVEINGQTISSQKNSYVLNISEKSITYNLEINTCGTDSFFIDKDNIWLSPPMCTEICCDGRNDTLATYIYYSGRYYLKDTILTIINDRATLFLEKK